MNKNRLTIIAAALFFIPLSIAIQANDENPYTNQYSTCMEASGGVTQSMVECMSDELEIQDQRLNDAYRAIRSELPEKRQIALRDAQRLWISYRDANCYFYATGEGTMARLISNDCFLSATAERATELENMQQP